MSEAAAMLKIFASTMNSLVLQIMDQKASGRINDKFIDGYFSFYRLLRFTASKVPEVARICKEAVESFISQPNKRSKNFVPNLGELLVYTLVCEPGTWDRMASIFLAECDARNYMWYAARADSPLKHLFYNTTVPKDRARLVFKETATSRNIVAFQVRFAQVARAIPDDAFEHNFGLAPEDVRTDLRDVYTKVTGLPDWAAYFTWLQIPPVSEEARTAQLIDAMHESRRVGYHK